MKQNLLTLFFTLLGVLTASADDLKAYDFVVDGIYYEKNKDSVSVSVTQNGEVNRYSGDITIPSTVTYDGKSYPVTAVSGSAFAVCKDLTSVTLPASVTSIGNQAFYDCPSLAAFYGPRVSEDHRCVIVDGKLEAFNPVGITSYTIPEGVTSIEGAFIACKDLTSVTLPESLDSISAWTFEGCSSLEAFYGKFASEDHRCLVEDGVLKVVAPAGLTSYTLPKGVTCIGDAAFDDCSSLTSVTLPEGVTSISWAAFSYCKNLASVTLPKSMKDIGPQAFEHCSSLTSINIPKGVTRIGNAAFQACSSLTSITIPKSVSDIHERTFEGCISLKAFRGKFASKDHRCIIVDGEMRDFAPAGLTSYTIPKGVTSINGAFCGCSNLTSVTIPKGVTSIGVATFSGCSNLTSVTIPEGVTCIGSVAFSDCSNLTSVTIPGSVTNIGELAFYKCSSLTTMTVDNTDASKIAVKPMFGIGKPRATLYVPAAGRASYNGTIWSHYFKTIKEY